MTPRRWAIGLACGMGLDTAVWEVIQVVDAPAIHNSHGGAQFVASLAIYFFGFVIGWGASK